MGSASRLAGRRPPLWLRGGLACIGPTMPQCHRRDRGKHQRRSEPAARRRRRPRRCRASVASRKPTPQLPWPRLSRRRPVAASTRSASTLVAMLALVRPKPKRNSAANRLAVPTARAAHHQPAGKERQRRQQRPSRAVALDDAADDQRTGEHARRDADQGEAELRFAEPHRHAQFGDAREEGPHRRAMGGEDQHDRQPALVAAQWSQGGVMRRCRKGGWRVAATLDRRRAANKRPRPPGSEIFQESGRSPTLGFRSASAPLRRPIQPSGRTRPRRRATTGRVRGDVPC